jgi:hypothetical protein
MAHFLPRGTVFCLLCLAVAATAHGQGRPPGYAREGTYVGIAPQVDATLDGVSFDGLTVYRRVGGTELAILPKLDRRTMMRAIVGFRSRPLAIEFSFERARHGGRFENVPVESVLTAFNVDGRFFFLTDRRVQPHAVIGISVPMLRVEDGSVDDPLVGDARWRGTGLNTEFGVTVFASDRFGVSVGYVYRPMWFTTVRGVRDEPLELLPEFRETSTNPTIMAFWTF